MAFRIVSQPQQQKQQAPQPDRGFLASMLAPFINTGKNIGGAGVEGLRALALASPLSGAKTSSGESFASIIANLQNPFMNESALSKFNPESFNLKTGNPLEQQLRDSASIGAYAVPFTKPGFRGALAPGALSGLLSGLGQEGADGESLAISAGGGALTAGVLSKLIGGRGAKVADEATAGVEGATTSAPGKLERTGTAMRRSVLNPQVSKTPLGPAEERAALALQERLGLAGTGRQQWEQLGSIYDDLNAQVGQQIKSGSNRAVSKPGTIDRIRTFVTEEGDNFVAGDSTYNKVLERELNQFGKIAKGDAVTAQDLFKYKNKIAGKLGNAFRKSKGDLGSSLTIPEEVRLDIWKYMDDLIADLEPSVKELTKQQSELYSLAPGLQKTANEKMQIPITGGRVSTAPLQALKDKTGRTLQSIGRGTSQQTAPSATSSIIAPETRQILQQLIPKSGAILSGQGGSGGGTALPMPSTMDTVPGAGGSGGIQQPDSQEVLKQILAAAVISGDISGSDISALQALGVFGDQGGEALTEGQQSRADASQLVSSALRALDTGNIKTGPIAPKFENFKSIFNAGDPETVEFNALISSLRAGIAKARAGTAFTPNEEKLLNQYTPQVGDSEQQLRTKLTVLQQIFPSQ